MVKAKLHILACDQPWSYDAIANSNAGNTDQATYTTPHFLGTGAAETSADAFRTASGLAGTGTPVDAVVNCDHFSITTLPTYTGPDVRVYSMDGAIIDVNTECGTAVGTDGVDMEFSQAESGDCRDATPTNLRRAVGAGNHLSAIVRWSRSQPRGSPAVFRFLGTPRPSLLPTAAAASAKRPSGAAQRCLQRLMWTDPLE